MTKFLPRSITFTIPGKLGLGVQVTAVENENGNLDFTVDVPGSAIHVADLRGLFFQIFDESDLAGLKILGGDGLITGTQIKPNGVIDLGNGNNLNGAASPFDVGIAFGTAGKGQDLITGPVHFTLDATQPLTLDDLAHVLFGTRLTSVGDKLTLLAPAAPDAIDDPVSQSTTTHEDTPLTIPVLANDTDGDGDTLTVTGVSVGPDAHGTAKVSDDGKSIIYTPAENYAGANTNSTSVDATLQYSISDGHGGQDSATVNVHVIPIADAPKVTVEVLKPHDDDPVNVVRLKVTATVSDADGSEFIDRIEFGALPPGWSKDDDGNLKTTGQPGTATEEVKLTLPTGTDLNFDFTATAYAQEKGTGDPDEASGSGFKNIGVDFNHNQGTETFATNNQSIWQTGGAFSVDQDLFFGGNQPFAIDGLVDGHVKAGFTANLHLNGGDIDATLPVDVTVDTTYNKATDSLLIHTNTALAATGASFTTTGPEGNLALGFLIDAAIDAGILGDGSINEILPVIPGFPAQFGTNSTFSTQGQWGSVSAAWPHLAVTNESQTGNTITGDNPSNDFITIVADIDGIATLLLFPTGPIHDILTTLGPDYQDADPESTFQLLDFDITGTAKLLEQFVLKLVDVNGTLIFEDGKTQQFKLGDDILIHDAKTHDFDGDGTIDFKVALTPNATLDNNLSANLGVHGDLWLIKNAGAVAEGLAELAGVDLPLHWDVFAAATNILIVDGVPFNLVGFGQQNYEFFV
jgi:hypothetical protein